MGEFRNEQGGKQMTAIRDASTMYASMFCFVLFMILFESHYSKKTTTILTLSLMLPLMIVGNTFGLADQRSCAMF